jgi:dTDP-4-amino-4,6-dideoxygalactose transaminase
LDKEIEHRRIIAKIYIQNINRNIISPEVIKNCELSTNIRFPIFIDNRKNLINYLKENGIFVSDIWYDAPIAPSKLIGKTDYNGSCPESDKISKQILNLPTHINVSRKDAEKISALINWQNTNQK